MANLFLSSTEKTKLNHTLNSLESINGNVAYLSVLSVYNDECVRWDCFRSCYCANSLL